MKPRLLACLAVAPVLLTAQQLAPEARERMERAHQVQEGVPASEVAEQLTEQAAGVRPGEAALNATALGTTGLEAPALNAAIPRRNFIDDDIFGRIEHDGIPRAGLASDREFARRTYLDATGRVPPVAELLPFLDDSDPDKRDKLVDRLVDSEEFVERWSYYFEDLFRAGNRMGFGKNLFHYWIVEWLRLDRSYADVVTDLLTQGGEEQSFVAGGALLRTRLRQSQGRP